MAVIKKIVSFNIQIHTYQHEEICNNKLSIYSI